MVWSNARKGRKPAKMRHYRWRITSNQRRRTHEARRRRAERPNNQGLLRSRPGPDTQRKIDSVIDQVQG
ncbi:hypothetical protein, partial [Sphingobium sp. LB126]|uniref:hypothetical protein n=1 Tax=Sphingobium sp. LB126 TaxID=1983755 RepID=UPI001F5BBC6E